MHALPQLPGSRTPSKGRTRSAIPRKVMGGGGGGGVTNYVQVTPCFYTVGRKSIIKVLEEYLHVMNIQENDSLQVNGGV